MVVLVRDMSYQRSSEERKHQQNFACYYAFLYNLIYMHWRFNCIYNKNNSLLLALQTFCCKCCTKLLTDWLKRWMPNWEGVRLAVCLLWEGWGFVVLPPHKPRPAERKTSKALQLI